MELIVVGGIVVIISVMFLVNFRGTENKFALENEAEKIASILRQAQMLTLIGQTSGGDRHNYGVHISTCTSGSCPYYLFGDEKEAGNKTYDADEEDNGGFGHNILKGVYVSSVAPGAGTDLDVVFEVPLGTIYFNGAAVGETATITLEHALFDGIKNIIINRSSGQIEIE